MTRLLNFISGKKESLLPIQIHCTEECGWDAVVLQESAELTRAFHMDLWHDGVEQ